MNASSSIRGVGRTLTASVRSSPVAGPSRIPLHTPRLRSFATTNVARKPVTEVCARTANPMSSILDALAIMRAVEAKYGQVIDFQVPRDPDSLQPTNLMFITFLEPVELGSNRHIHEIPAPVSEIGEKQIYGGPSLADVQAALATNPDRALQPRSDRRQAPAGKVLTFEVELRRTAPRSRRDPTVKKITPEVIAQDEKILDALERFGDGFYGGFEGVAAKHRKVLEAQKQGLERGDDQPAGSPSKKGTTKPISPSSS